VKTHLLPALAIIALAAAPAQAALVTRSMLIRACTSHDQRQLNDCAGYLAGIADMTDTAQQGVCIPKGLNVRLLRQGITTWLQSHTTSDGPAAPSVLDALRHLYSCKS
jgi:hypothetical protein